MRIRIAHETRYVYERPMRAMLQILRLTPTPHDGLHILSWGIDTETEETLKSGRDAFGNLTTTLSTTTPLSSLSLRVHGEVETSDTHGVLSRAPEPLPPEVFLRSTPLTAIDDAMTAFAEDAAGMGEPLEKLHRLLTTLYEEVRFDTEATSAGTSAAEAFALKRGVCQDLTHIFIACARHIGAPARYVSGHLARGDGVVDQEASHAWAEAHVAGLGWVGFDPTNGVCPGEGHVRVACAFDYLGAAPVRGARIGGGEETLTVTLNVAPQTVGQRQAQA